MASTTDYVTYACEQMRLAGVISYKKMFGEYSVYCDGKVVGLICDNQLFIKPTSAADRLIPDAQRLPPYDGAKPYVVIEDLDNTELLTRLVIETCAELPMPKPKKKKDII